MLPYMPCLFFFAFAKTHLSIHLNFITFIFIWYENKNTDFHKHTFIDNEVLVQWIVVHSEQKKQSIGSLIRHIYSHLRSVVSIEYCNTHHETVTGVLHHVGASGMNLVLVSHLFVSWLCPSDLKNNLEHKYFIPESIANYNKSLNSQQLHEKLPEQYTISTKR